MFCGSHKHVLVCVEERTLNFILLDEEFNLFYLLILSPKFYLHKYTVYTVDSINLLTYIVSFLAYIVILTDFIKKVLPLSQILVHI